MRRASRFFRLGVSVALSCLLLLASCQKKMPGRLDGQYASDTASSASTGEPASSADETEQTSGQKTDTKQTKSSDAGQVKEAAAPAFRSGNYTMESSSVSEQHFYSGKSDISYTRVSQIYNYDIKLTVKKDGSMTAVYSFRRIRTGYETEEGSLVTDTNEKSGRDEDNAVYYDLIGQRFTVSVSKAYQLTIKGIDAIHKKFPYTADIVTDENMKEVASDLFYQMDGSLKRGSAWTLTQAGMKNTYTVASIKNGSVYVNIKGEQLELPKPYTSNGVTYTYQKREPLSGSLVMALDNRMIQEQSSYQENTGVIESGGKRYTFSESAASVCNIKKK